MCEAPKAVIFDWDDTLAYTRKAVVEAMEYVLAKYGKESWDITKKKYRDTTKSLKENFVNFFGNSASEAYQEYLNYYQNNSYQSVVPAENSAEFLKLLQSENIPFFIISNKEKSLLLKEVGYCFPQIKFSKILGNGDAEKNKPSPCPVFKALENSNVDINRKNVWLIGDSKQDTECAYGADVFPVLIGSGKFMEDDYIKNKLSSDKPLHVFNNFQELILRFKQITLNVV